MRLHVYKGDVYFVAEDLDSGIASQGRFRHTAIKNLKEAMEMHQEARNRHKTIVMANRVRIAQHI